MPAAALAAAGAAVFALLLALPGRSARDGGGPVRQRLSWRGLRPSDPVGRHAVRYLLGIAAGLTVATTGIGHPYWTFVTASVPMSAPDLHARLTRAAQRVIGTAAGLGVAALVLAAHPTGYAAIIVIAALQACTELTTGRNYSLGRPARRADRVRPAPARPRATPDRRVDDLARATSASAEALNKPAAAVGTGCLALRPPSARRPAAVTFGRGR